MEFLSNEVREVVLKQDQNLIEDVDLIETIINTKENSEEAVISKVSSYIKKNGADKSLAFLVGLINFAALIRVKSRKSIKLIISHITKEFDVNWRDFICNHTYFMDDRWIPNISYTEIFEKMLQNMDLVREKNLPYQNIFDVFSEDEKISISLMNDDLDLLQTTLVAENLTTDLYYHNNKRVLLFPFNNRSEIKYIQLAAYFGSPRCFKYLLLNDSIPYHDTHQSFAPLGKFAIAGGSNEIVQLVNQNGETFSDCLKVAIAYHHFDLINWIMTNFKEEDIHYSHCLMNFNNAAFFYFVSTGMSIYDEMKDPCGRSPLIWASINGDFNLVRYLVDKGVDVNIQDANANTAFTVSAERGHLSILQYLSEKGADIFLHEAPYAVADAPLNSAAQNGFTKIVKFLVEKGTDVDPEIKNYEMTPLIYAAENDHIDIMKFLIEHGADVNKKLKNGTTPLLRAAMHANYETIKFLIEKGADIRAVYSNGDNVLLSASAHCSVKVFRYLLSLGADINVVNDIKQTVLHYAAIHGNLELIKELIERGFNVNVKDANGSTPLHWASRNGNKDACDLLINAGADQNITNNKGEKPTFSYKKKKLLDMILMGFFEPDDFEEEFIDDFDEEINDE